MAFRGDSTRSLTAGLLAAACLALVIGPASPISSALQQGPARGARPLHPGTRTMVERLSRIADGFDQVNLEQSSKMVFGTNQPHLIPVLRKLADAATSPMERYGLRTRLAAQLLQAGFSAEALDELERLQRSIVEMPETVASREQKAAELVASHGAIGIAALRLGEQENCLLNHRATSCLFPLDRAAIHTLQRGARRAIQAFTRQLEAQPTNLGAAWLLNIAYMTVGEYPDHVPRQWLFGPELFASEYDIKRFPDVATATGVDSPSLAGGSIVDDFNNDGLMDIVVSSWGIRDQLRLFRNDGSGRFVDRTAAAGLTGLVGGINVTHADYNNDGHLDIYVMRGGWLREAGLHPDSLLRNNGDGTFADVTEEAGLLSLQPTHTAAWGDFNNDGFLDLFAGHEDWGANKHAVQLFVNNRNGTFTDIAPRVGFGVMGVVKGAAWGDYNNDGRLDLYVSIFGKPNLLFRNDGGRFTEVAAAAGVQQPIFSFPTWFFDYDNDGWQDLFVGGFDEAPIDAVAALYRGVPRTEGVPRLYRNRRDGTFEDVTRTARLDRVMLAMGANFGDLDNDGFLDIYVGNGAPDLRSLLPNRMFRNAGGRVFQDVTTSGGFGHLQKGHGVAWGDIDNDGDQDIYEVIGGWFTGDTYQNVLFENPGHGNHWLAVTLEGVRSNRAAIGARIKVRVTTPRGPRDIYATVSAGGSFGSSTLQQEIGLGDAQAIESLEVAWPTTGERQLFTNVARDQFIRIREGSSAVTRVARRRIVLAHDDHSGAHR